MSRVARRIEGEHRRAGGRAPVVLAAVAAVVVLGIVADLALGAPTVRRPEPAAQEPAVAGSWYCPSVAGEGEKAVLTIASVSGQPSIVTVVRYAEGDAILDEPVTVAAGGELVVPLDGAAARRPTAVRWQGGAVVASWRVDGERTTAAPCEASTAERWLVTGFDTTLGSESRLHLFNPYPGDAVVRLVFATPDGPVRLVLSDSIIVRASGTTTVNLRRFQPEVPDLGVTVDVLVGRVVAQGESWLDPPGDQPGVSGRVLLSASPAPGDTWTWAYARAGSESESWLSVLNPAEREAAVEVRVTAPAEGGGGSIGEFSVPAGGVARIELADVSANDEFAVTLTVVNDVQVVATRLSAIGSGGRRGVVASLGADAPDTEWALVGGGTGDREGLVAVYNPGPEPAVVDFVADGAPPEWSAVEVAPNGRAKVDLGDLDDGRASIPVLVRSDRPVVAEMRSVATGQRLRPWTAVGVPVTAWRGPPTLPTVRRDADLPTRYEPPPPRVDDEAPEPLPEPGDGDDPGTEAPAASG